MAWRNPKRVYYRLVPYSTLNILSLASNALLLINEKFIHLTTFPVSFPARLFLTCFTHYWNLNSLLRKLLPTEPMVSITAKSACLRLCKHALFLFYHKNSFYFMSCKIYSSNELLLNFYTFNICYSFFQLFFFRINFICFFCFCWSFFFQQGTHR